MASKRQSALGNPPSASSSSDSESSDELTNTRQHISVPNQSQNFNSAEESSDEEEEEKKTSGEKLAPHPADSDETGSVSTDTAPSPTASDFKIKHVDDSDESKVPAQSPNGAGSRLAPHKDVSDLKLNEKESQRKAKPSNGVGSHDDKRGPIARLWSDDDELAIIRGMDEYWRKKGHDPYADKDAFHEFMKRFLSVEVTKIQLMDKVRRLKKKYENNVKKGEDPVISKPHELKLFEISKAVWGRDGVVAADSSAVVNSARNGKRMAGKSVGGGDLVSKESNAEKSNKKPKKSVEVKTSLDLDEGFWDAYPHFKEALELENSGYFSKGGRRAMEAELSKIGAVKAKAMDDKWRGFHAKEVELQLLKLDLVKEQTKLLFYAVKAEKP